MAETATDGALTLAPRRHDKLGIIHRDVIEAGRISAARDVAALAGGEHVFSRVG